MFANPIKAGRRSFGFLNAFIDRHSDHSDFKGFEADFIDRHNDHNDFKAFETDFIDRHSDHRDLNRWSRLNKTTLA